MKVQVWGDFLKGDSTSRTYCLFPKVIVGLGLLWEFVSEPSLSWINLTEPQYTDSIQELFQDIS